MSQRIACNTFFKWFKHTGKIMQAAFGKPVLPAAIKRPQRWIVASYRKLSSLLEKVIFHRRASSPWSAAL